MLKYKFPLYQVTFRVSLRTSRFTFFLGWTSASVQDLALVLLVLVLVALVLVPLQLHLVPFHEMLAF
jgi:hypothetical protein